MSKLKKTLLISIITIVSIITLVIIFISPITKYGVEKYDEEYLGRKITMDWAYVNPFTGYIYLNNLKIYEKKSNHLFFSANSIHANFEMSKLFFKTYEISELTINHPRGIIIQHEKNLNFDDLIALFSSKEKTTIPEVPVHFNLLNIKIIDGEFRYLENVTPINYFVKNVNIESTGLRWDADTIAANFSFLSGIGSGDVKGNLTINTTNLDYRYDVDIHKFDLDFINQYLKDLINYGSFSAKLDAGVKAKGNFKDQENLTASGKIAFNEFHFGKNPAVDYASFDKLEIGIVELSPNNHKYLFDTVSLSRPYFKYERYDYLDNFQNMFGQEGSNISSVSADANKFNLIIEIARYVKVLANNFLSSNYKINRLGIYNGDIQFNDFSTSEKFAIALNPLTIEADSVDKSNKTVKIALRSGVIPYGNISANLSVNPKDSSDFDLYYHLQKLPMALFNPYIISYTSFPLDKGTLEFEGKWHVRDGVIKSTNHLTIIDPRTTERIKNKNTKWVPVPLIMAFLREKGNVIDYEIPITGNLKNPKFHLRDVIFDVLKNIFVKPLTINYRVQVKNIETEIEKSIVVKWGMGSSSPLPENEKFIKKIANFLSENPKAVITIHPYHYGLKEKEYILFFEAKKKYHLFSNNKNVESFSKEDSLKVAKMSVKNPSFVQYLNKLQKDSMLFTIQEKCVLYIGKTLINTKYKSLNEERKNAFMVFFKEKGLQKQVIFSNAENLVPYNGFSFYKISYNGIFPNELMNAYYKMNELNEEAPREKFKEEREQTQKMK